MSACLARGAQQAPRTGVICSVLFAAVSALHAGRA